METLTPETVLELAQTLSPAAQRWLVETLSHQLDEALPERATLAEAVELFLADQGSLGRAAELASVTRWDLQAALKERNILIPIYGEMSAEQMDDLAEQLEHEGYL